MSDRYEILATLGSGANSTVYLARHLRLKTLRAIKCIPKNTAPSSSFPSEVSILKSLNSPTIPTLYDFEENESFFYLIEEYVEGESLEAFLLHQSIISEQFILQLAIQLCDVLCYLHTLWPDPILYLDLKPEHIIVCGDTFKLIDFGSATFLKQLGNNIKIYGTPEYAAPELTNPSQISTQADLYSLGKVLLFVMESCGHSCSLPLSRIIQKATAVSLTERYQTAAQLKKSFIRLLPDTCQSHLLRTIGIISSDSGVGATHLAISTVSVLNKNNYSCFYEEKNNKNSLTSMIQNNSHFVERNGLYSYQYFQAIPHFGESIQLPSPKHGIHVKDYGVYQGQDIELEQCETLLFIMGSRDWELEHAYAIGEQITCWNNLVFICNYGNRNIAKAFARHFEKKVYCFPLDADPFCITREKEQLLLEMLALKGGHLPFSFRKKGTPSFISPLESLE